MQRLGAWMRIKQFAGVVVAIMIVGGSLTLVEPSAVAAIAIAPDTLATTTAHVGEPYLATLSFEGGAAWSVASGQLPPGLSLIAGQITGVPTEGGAYTFVVNAIGTSTVQKKYTILVNPATSTGYDSRMQSVLLARDAMPPAGECNNTSYTTYAMADLWRNRNPTDVNNKLQSLKFSHFGGDPSACSAHSDQARNNLKLAYLVRGVHALQPDEQLLPRPAHARGREQSRRADVDVREQVQQEEGRARQLGHLRQRKP